MLNRNSELSREIAKLALKLASIEEDKQPGPKKRFALF